MKNKIFKVYLNLKSFDDKEFKKLWDYVFDNADCFSLRFPNREHATSNTMKLKYNNKGEPDEEFISYINKNQALICDCDRYVIKKYISNIYLDEKYGSLAQIYYCKIFDRIKKMVYKHPNVCEWLEPDLPEDLSFHRNGEYFLYTCSHEDICILYIDKSEQEKLTAMGLI